MKIVMVVRLPTAGVGLVLAERYRQDSGQRQSAELPEDTSPGACGDNRARQTIEG
jgi:hypothetical protein